MNLFNVNFQHSKNELKLLIKKGLFINVIFIKFVMPTKRKRVQN